MSKRVLYKKKGDSAIYQTICAPNKPSLALWIDDMVERGQVEEILNTLPLERAVELMHAAEGA